MEESRKGKERSFVRVKTQLGEKNRINRSHLGELLCPADFTAFCCEQAKQMLTCGGRNYGVFFSSFCLQVTSNLVLWLSSLDEKKPLDKLSTIPKWL